MDFYTEENKRVKFTLPRDSIPFIFLPYGKLTVRRGELKRKFLISRQAPYVGTYAVVLATGVRISYNHMTKFLVLTFISYLLARIVTAPR